MLKGINFLHQNNIIHRDLKAANLLITNQGVLKIADFGLGRFLKTHNKHLTQDVVTFPYRAPELILGDKNYNEKIDIWSIGCIFGEFLIRKHLFNEQGDRNQIFLMYQLLGEPQFTWPEIEQLKHWRELRPLNRHQSQIE